MTDEDKRNIAQCTIEATLDSISSDDIRFTLEDECIEYTAQDVKDIFDLILKARITIDD